ncbi:hypothetical protein ESCO_005382 [Escovopsis weberi]|uniref:Uncharacterized protein n=1 Tax=Escovopsis weberi TaxID=150374 RepID=A0A0M8N4I0_ESCWE|nr:hypothetical protein ESCO_005382 [Escovopsis weberi]
MAPIQSRMHIPQLSRPKADRPPDARAPKDPNVQMGISLLVVLIVLVALGNFVRIGMKRRRRRLAEAAAAAISPTQSEIDVHEAVQRAMAASAAAAARDDASITDPAPPYSVYAEGEPAPSYTSLVVPPPPYKSQESIITRPAPAVLAD